MKRFKPIHGVILVLLFTGVVLMADFSLSGGLGHSGFERVSPVDGVVRLDLSDLEPLEVRFYRFLNSGNQEVKFFVGRDARGTVQVAFDASETDYKRRRGFRHEGEWMVNNKCDTACRLSEVNSSNGGCRPVPLVHRVVGDELILQESDILAGWRYFR